MKIGIDFGTSFSLPATFYLDQNILLLPGGKYGIPSVFYYDEWAGVLIGEGAERAGQGNNAKNLVREIKLDLRSTFAVDDKTFSAKQIVSYILRYVQDCAITTAREKLIEDPLEGVVISVPAKFEHNEKEIIKAAATMSTSKGGPNFKVLGFIKEPVAAALAYFKTALADHTRVLVYDLGGGTCDIAIVEANSKKREKFTVVDSDMIRVGGKDWDERLKTFIIHEVEKQSGKAVSNNPGYIEKIRREAVIAKHAFSESILGKHRDRVRANIEIDGQTYQIPITKSMFDEMTMDLFRQTVNLTKKVLDRNDGVHIDQIICVGGSSNMPQVQEGLKREFGKKHIRVFEPEKAIAYGAAIYADFCDGTDDYLSDIAVFSYGTNCYENYDKDPTYMIVVNLVKSGDRLPVTQKHSFCTVADNQRSMSFKIFEDPKPVSQYDYDKEMKPIMDISLDLPSKSPKGTEATLYMTLTVDGIIEVTAEDKTGKRVHATKQLYF